MHDWMGVTIHLIPSNTSSTISVPGVLKHFNRIYYLSQNTGVSKSSAPMLATAAL
jgi:hypothetical protein